MADTDRSRLFISYSRADLPFTDELVAGLAASADFEILIDRDTGAAERRSPTGSPTARTGARALAA